MYTRNAHSPCLRVQWQTTTQALGPMTTRPFVLMVEETKMAEMSTLLVVYVNGVMKNNLEK